MPDVKPFTLPSIAATEALGLAADGAILLDLRKPAARTQSGKTVVGAALRDPYKFTHGDAMLRRNEPIITFCVHGHEVSQFGCALLLLHGREVAYVRGGFEALVAAGAPLEELPDV